MKKIILSIIYVMLVLVVATGCGKTQNNELNSGTTNNSTQESTEQNNNVKVDLPLTYKVPGVNIYVNVPNWDPMELTYSMMTTVYKIQGSKYVAITDVNEKVNSLEEAHEKTFEVFKENLYRYHPINSVSFTSQENDTINGINVYRYEGTMNCRQPNNTSANYDAYVIGYSFILDDTPCSIIGSVQDVSQTKEMIDEMRATVESMIKTIRTQR